MTARRALILSLTALVMLSAASLLLGASGLAPGDIARALIAGDRTSAGYRILVHVRLPRLMTGIAVGASLAVSGMILQSVLFNPLASPGLLGINAGAGLGALTAVTAWPGIALLVPTAAFAGALLAALLVYGLAAALGASRKTLILSGVAVSSMLGAAMDFIVTLMPDAVPGRSAFAIGGFAAATLPGLMRALPFMAAGLAVALWLRRETAILSLGDDVARGVGVEVGHARPMLLAAAALLAGAAVSVAGLVGFVGLIAPHACRALIGEGEGAQLPLTAALGAALAVSCDLIARTAFAPFELPVGIVLSALGCPFFLLLLFRSERRGRHAGA